jgi:crotonobetainyl-CoA:carnitine CoA-transferase CaiB-like acyl-CoA transferase
VEQREQDSHPARPLSGIRVVDVGVWHAGPGAAAILGDLGADVIRVEGIEGDPERYNGTLGPVTTDAVNTDDWTVLFDMSNRNKRAVAADLRSEEGKEIVRRLVADADVFITNMKRTTVSKLGIDYVSLSKVNERLVHINVTGFGSEGPLADAGAMDTLGQAMAGMMYLRDAENPSSIQALVLDQLTAIVASNAAVTGLLARELHGIGQDIHVSLFGSATWLMHANLLATSALGGDFKMRWDRRNNPATRTTFRCGDGGWIVGTNHPEQKYWPKFCAALGLEALTQDARFADPDARRSNRDELFDLLDARFAERTRAEWLAELREVGLLFAPIQSFFDVLTDEQARANGYIREFEHPRLGAVPLPGFPIRFGKQEAGIRSAAPGLGEHTDQVLRELGYDDDAIFALRERSVIR